MNLQTLIQQGESDTLEFKQSFDKETIEIDSYPSRTRNKLIAEAFYLTSGIEKYGSGYQRIRKAIQDYPTMTFEYEESGDGYMVSMQYSQQKQTTNNSGITEQETEQVQRLLKAIGMDEKSTQEIMNDLGLNHRPTFLYDYLQPAIKQGWVEMKYPDSPKSPKQKYRLSENAKLLLKTKH